MRARLSRLGTKGGFAEDVRIRKHGRFDFMGRGSTPFTGQIPTHSQVEMGHIPEPLTKKIQQTYATLEDGSECDAWPAAS